MLELMLASETAWIRQYMTYRRVSPLQASCIEYTFRHDELAL